MSFTSSQRQTLLNKIKGYNMFLMASFGGATSFPNGFQQILNSPKYSDPTVLANDLVTFLYNNNIPGIDLDIENIPSIGTYSNTINLVNYLGELSQSIKSISTEKFGYQILVSHAPQSPYFNGTPTYSNFGNIYNQIEYLYGSGIDFYNIQYYNQGNSDYIDYNSIFVSDPVFYAAVSQLENASSINSSYYNIPLNKIVVGKPSSAAGVTSQNGYVPLSELSDIINQTQIKYTSWYENGGVMIWIYLIGSNDPQNTEILTYFNSVKH
jgi:chitinase